MIWRGFCANYFSYMDFLAPDIRIVPFSFTIALILIPLLAYRNKRTLSNFISTLIYVFVYGPTQQTIYYQNIAYSDFSIIKYMIVLCLAQTAFFAIESLKISSPDSQEEIFKPLDKTKLLIIGHQLKAIYYLSILLMVVILIEFHGKFNFYALEDASKFRIDQKDIYEGSLFGIGYILSWLAAFFIPLLFLMGVFSKKYHFIVLSFFSCFILYGLNTMKINLFEPIILLTFYCLLKANFRLPFLSLLQGGLSILCYIFVKLPNDVSLFYTLKCILFERIIASPGHLFVQYEKFFRTNPKTYFSHINVVKYFWGNYPYGNRAIGQVVHGGDSNSCASFFAMDGVASANATGVCIISVIFCIYLILMRYISIKYIDTREKFIFYCTLFVPSTMALINSSFFTYLWTRGVFFAILLIISNSLLWTKIEHPQTNATPSKNNSE